MFDTSVMQYDATDWYWARRDGTLWSSRRVATVSPSDREYQEWVARSRVPTPYPVNPETGREDPAELQRVLDDYNLHASLEHYAAGVRWTARNAGALAQVGGATVRVNTDAATIEGLSMVTIRILRKTRKDGEILKVFADGKPRACSNSEAGAIIDAATGHVQAAMDREETVLSDIAARKLTTKDDVDAAFSDLMPS